jgi:hypothetical protein
LAEWVLDKIPKTYGKRVVKFFVAVYRNTSLQPLRAKIAMNLDRAFGTSLSVSHNRRDGAAMRVRPWAQNL